MTLMMMRRLGVIAVALGSMALPNVSLAQDATTLKISTPFPFTRTDPMLEGGNYYVFGGAELPMRFEPDGTVKPWLLKDLVNVDPQTWRLVLRPEVKFQNGNALTAQKLADLLNFLITRSPVTKQYFTAAASFRVTSPEEVTFTTDKPFPSLPGLLADRRAFPVFDINAYQAANGDPKALLGKGLLTAPYEIVSINDKRMVMKRNDTYWAGKPPLSGVSVEFVVDPNASMLAVRNGELDVAAFSPVSLKPLVDKTPGLHFKTGNKSSDYRFYQAFMNVHAGPLTDANVRLALLKAINYAEIAKDVFGGAYSPATGFYVPLHSWAESDQTYVPADAERLLDEAGWKKGADGLRMKDGKALQIRANFDRGSSDLQPIGAAMQNQLRKIGVGFSMTPVDDPYAAAKQTQWDLTMHAQATSPIPETFLVRHMAKAGDRNLAGYDNPEVLKLIDELGLTVDEKRRKVILVRIQKVLSREDPYIFNIVFYQPPAIVNDAYRNYEPGFDTRMVDAKTAPSR
jgi:peptide/nickel transport system substrate-binding protein